MKSDIESIKKSKNIYIFADKTNNIYESEEEEETIMHCRKSMLFKNRDIGKEG